MSRPGWGGPLQGSGAGPTGAPGSPLAGAMPAAPNPFKIELKFYTCIYVIYLGGVPNFNNIT